MHNIKIAKEKTKHPDIPLTLEYIPPVSRFINWGTTRKDKLKRETEATLISEVFSNAS